MNVKLIVIFSIFLFSCKNGNQASKIKESISQESIDNVNSSAVFGTLNVEFDKFCIGLEEHSLPINYSFEFIIDLPKFKPLPENLNQFFVARNVANASIAKMPNHNNNQIFMIAWLEESGETLLELCSITDEIRRLPIFYAKDYDRDGQLGTIKTTFEIAKNYEIFLTEVFTPFDSDNSSALVLNESNYVINSKGHFVEKK